MDKSKLKTKRRSRRRASAVPHEDVDAAERGNGLPDDRLEIARIRDVTAHGERTDPIRFALQHVTPPREHGHVRAFARQSLGRREAETGRCTAHDRSAASETEIHGYEVSKPTTSRTAPADSFSIACSSSFRSSS